MTGRRRLCRAVDLTGLADAADQVGDVVKADQPFTEVQQQPFIWLNGEVILGTELDRHSGILNESGEISDVARRLLSFAAGHVVGDAAVVEEATCTNVDPAQVVADVLEQLDVEKVYLADTEFRPTLTRAALRRLTRR